MKFNTIMIALLTLLSGTEALGQFTKYDDVPGNIKTYKPAYQDDYPEWAKMLYEEEVNFLSIKAAFDQWEQKGSTEFRPIRRYFKNWMRNIEPWVDTEGLIDLSGLDEYYKSRLKNQKEVYTKSQSRGDAHWTFVGPKETFWLNESGAVAPPPAAPWQVNIYSLDVAPSNSDVLYCGTETGYVNKTVDKGISWQQMGLDYHFGGGITAVAIDPTNDDIVYVSGGHQLHKTTDGGLTWTPLLSGGQSFHTDRLEIDRDDNSVIYAAANTGIYISRDHGESWSPSFHSRTYDIHRHPVDPSIVYGLSEQAGNFRVVISEDGGATFSDYPNFPQGISNAAGGLLAVSDASPDKLYVIMLSSDNTPMIYKGDHETGEWEWVATGNTSNFALNNGQGYFDLVFEVSDQDADLIYAGTSTLYVSRNGGQNFEIVGGYGGAFPIHPDIQDIKLLDDGEVWVSTDGGMNYSSDNFVNTSNHVALINGIIGSDMWGFDQGWNEDLMVGGRYHNGNTSISEYYGDKALRMGGAESPTGWILKGKKRHVAFNDLGAGWILPGTAEGQPEGRFLFSKYPNMDEYGGRRGNIVTHPNYYGTLLLGEGNAVWKSEDSGMSYEMIYDFGNKVRYIEMAYADPDILYADVLNIGLMKSEDGGLSWEAKPALTSAPNGSANWAGRLFFCVSPSNANVVYACLQNGTWSSNIGRIFKSVDGGDSWEDWTGSISEYTKNLVVQPDENGNDIVYLFTNARDKRARVFYRNQDVTDWLAFEDGFPAGFQVNLAMPFFRDGKLRVAGNAGIWESPMFEQEFAPILNPWIEQRAYSCIYDTLFFEDHSIINHANSEWRWEFEPEPMYVSDHNVRNPIVVLGAEGDFDVTMYIIKNGVEHSVHMPDFVSATSCPSIEDCNNPDNLPTQLWDLVYVDSEETIFPGLATMAFDNDPETIWHTRWTSGNDQYPHEMIVDMGEVYFAHSFTYLPRQSGTNGRVKDYELYVSNDLSEWGEAISIGQFTNSFAPSTIEFAQPVEGRYFRLLCLSEVNGNIWASAAEISLEGCYASSLSSHDLVPDNIIAYPNPTDGIIEVSLPVGQSFEYLLHDATGKRVEQGRIDSRGKLSHSFDLSRHPVGLYFIKLRSPSSIQYTVKVFKGQ